MTLIDQTHDPDLRSWVQSANAPGCDFPIQNLPFGVFSAPGRAATVGVAIGDQILDVAAVAAQLEPDARAAAGLCAGASLNALMATGRSASGALRQGLSRLLSDDGARSAVEACLTPMAQANLLLPAQIRDYTDFYASVFHATNVGRLFRPDNPLLPNYKWVPIAYHGRASTVVVSGAPVRRPKGQLMAPGGAAPEFRLSRSLDYEMELGAYIGAPTAAEAPPAIDDAGDHLFGVCLLNDWSARDIQAWEYQPLGPFLSKSFATTVSPWVVTAEALAPFRGPAFERPEGDPAPLPYLSSPDEQAAGGLLIDMQAWLCTAVMREAGLEPVRVSHANASSLYWTVGQMITHHASNGCALAAGDLLGSGTVSGPDRRTAGCLLEITARGSEPVDLPSGERRAFLEDGDELILRARCDREGYASIGLGECRAVVLPAL